MKTKMSERQLDATRDILADFFKSRRRALGLSQQQVADRSGLARKTINAMEQGHYWLGMKQYFLVCEALHLSPKIAHGIAGESLFEDIQKHFV